MSAIPHMHAAFVTTSPICDLCGCDADDPRAFRLDGTLRCGPCNDKRLRAWWRDLLERHQHRIRHHIKRGA